MRDRISLEAVSTALKNDELGFLVLKIRLDLAPGLVKVTVLRSGLQRDIQLGPFRFASARFFCGAGSGVKIATILVHVREYQVGVFFEAVKNAVAMMCIDIDIGNPRQAVLDPQILNRDATVVKHAKTRSAVARRMMQAGYRHKCAFGFARHDGIDGCERGSDHV